MMKLTLTKNMKAVLERLFSMPDQSGFVTLRTAVALSARGMVKFSKRQRTAGGQFPEYFVALTTTGRKWCEQHYRNLGARNAP